MTQFLERQPVAIEKELYISSLRKLKVEEDLEGIVFDLDGVLVDDEAMRFHRSRAKKILFQGLDHSNGLTEEEFSKSFEELNDEAINRYGTSSVRWHRVLESIKKKFGKPKDPQVEMRFFLSVSSIYSSDMPLFDGVYDMLCWTKESDVKLAINSLSFPSWGKRKIVEIANYIDVLNFLDVGPKDYRSWQYVAHQMKIPTSRLIGVGDRLKDDAISSKLAGFRHSVLIHSSDRIGVLLNNNPRILDGIETISHINMFSDYVQKLASKYSLV